MGIILASGLELNEHEVDGDGWPLQPVAHLGDWMAARWGPTTWKTRPASYGQADPYPHCSYCGSLSTKALYTLVHDGQVPVKFCGSDWKYGYPHKFYLEGIPNPIGGQPAQIGTSSRSELQTDGTYRHIEEPIMGTASHTLFLKFYSEHLCDVPQSLFSEFADIIHERSRILFKFIDGKLHYSAPYHGYQHY